MLPATLGELDATPRYTRLEHRRHQEVRAQHVLCVLIPETQVIRELERHGTHDRKARPLRLLAQRLECGAQVHAHMREELVHSLRFRTELPRFTTQHAVILHHRTEGPELEPADVQLRGRLVDVAADVMTPEWRAAETRRQSGGEQRAILRPCRKLVTGPKRRRPFNTKACASPPQQAVDFLLVEQLEQRLGVPGRELVVHLPTAPTIGEHIVGLDVLAVVVLEAAHTHADLVTHLVLPPTNPFRAREIEVRETLEPFPAPTDRPVGLPDEEPPPLRLGEIRRCGVNDRNLPEDIPDAVRGAETEEAVGVGPTIAREVVEIARVARPLPRLLDNRRHGDIASHHPANRILRLTLMLEAVSTDPRAPRPIRHSSDRSLDADPLLDKVAQSRRKGDIERPCTPRA